MRDAEIILSSNFDKVGPKNAGRIWGFISKFVMLDRFIKDLGVAQIHPGVPVPRKLCTLDYLGNASKASILLTILLPKLRDSASLLTRI